MISVQTADIPEALPAFPADSPAFFLGGTGRSGTSMLLSILGRHPDIAAIPAETKVMSLEFFPLLLEEAPTANTRRRQEIADIIKEVWVEKLYRYRISWEEGEKAWRGLHRFVQPAVLEAAMNNLEVIRQGGTLEEIHQAYGRMVGQIFAAHANAQGKKLWVEKTPDNAMMAGFISRCFPNLRLINIVRDGRDVACSLVRVGWGTNDPKEALDWWAARLEEGMNAVSALPRGRGLTIRYEDLVLSLELVMRRLVDFLGIGWSPIFLEYTAQKGSLGRWRRDLPADAQAYALEKYGDLLRKLGYVSAG